MTTELRLRACGLVKNGQHGMLRHLFSQGQVTPNTQSSKNGLAPVHYSAHLFGSNCHVSTEDVCQVIRVLLEFKADFSITGTIENSSGFTKIMSAMDMVVSNSRHPGPGRQKYERGFLPNFRPVEITRALRSVPTSAPHPDLMKKVQKVEVGSPPLIRKSGLPPGIVRFIRERSQVE